MQIPSSITSSHIGVPIVVDSINNSQEEHINDQTPHNDIVMNEPIN